MHNTAGRIIRDRFRVSVAGDVFKWGRASLTSELEKKLIRKFPHKSGSLWDAKI